MSEVALIYVRRSMVRYEGTRASPERQLANCVRVCERKGWNQHSYTDEEAHGFGRVESQQVFGR